MAKNDLEMTLDGLAGGIGGAGLGFTMKELLEPNSKKSRLFDAGVNDVGYRATALLVDRSTQQD